MAVVVPITSKGGKLSGFELPLRAGRVDGVALLSGPRALDYQSRDLQFEVKADAAVVMEANRRIRMIFP
jgi:mRNA interferase MazF